MTYENALERLKKVSSDLAYFRSMEMLFMWDQWNGLPNSGQEYRQKLQGYMAGKRAEVLGSDEVKELAKYFLKINLTDIDNDIERAIIRNFISKVKYANVPKEKVQRLGQISGAAQGAWMKAKQQNDYNIFKPYFKEIFELRTEIIKSVEPNRPVFEVLLEQTDQDICLEEINREFNKVKKAVKKLMDKIKDSDVAIDDKFLNVNFDKNELLDFIKYAVETTGYDKNKGGYGHAPHQFTNIIGPNDARITIDCSSYKGGVFAAIHEAGHGMYGYSGNDEIDQAQLWGGIEGGFHEGQSRFYENIIGKSKAYWQYFYPEAQKRFKQFENISLEQYYKAINKVEPSLKRIVADEVTYSLHPIIRFELEQELINGTIDFDTLPQAWNDKYYDYLGIRPENDAEGVLQDIHWAAGMIGYFQSYTLGNIYGGQIRNTLLKAVPNVFDEISKGNFKLLNTWMVQNIYQYGNCYTANEIMRKVTGEGLNADYFIEYLDEKYSAIYDLK